MEIHGVSAGPNTANSEQINKGMAEAVIICKDPQ